MSGSGKLQALQGRKISAPRALSDRIGISSDRLTTWVLVVRAT